MLPGRGLTAHYFFTFGVEVQLVGDRKNTKVEQRILHLDVAAAAVKLVEKGSVRVFLRFDAINQIVFDDAEPRSVLISCRDERRYFIVFQSAEDNLVFRTACSDLAGCQLDINRFQRSVLKKGQLMKRGKAGALFGDRYAILTPRKLFVLPSKVSVFPSNAISLEEVSPRFDDVKGTIHLDVCGKEYVFQGSDKDESQDWFVEIARAATSRVPILQWDDVTGARLRPDTGSSREDEILVDEEELHGAAGGGVGHSPSHFTSPEDWDEVDSPDHHLDSWAALPGAEPHSTPGHSQTGQHRHGQSASGSTSSSARGAQHSRSGASGGQSSGWGIGKGQPGSFSSSGGNYIDPAGNVIRLSSGATKSLAGRGEGTTLRRSTSSASSVTAAMARPAAVAGRVSPQHLGPQGPGEGWTSASSTPRVAAARGQAAAADGRGVLGGLQQAAADQAMSSPVAGGARMSVGSSAAGRAPAMGTIYEAGESEGDGPATTSSAEDADDQEELAGAGADTLGSQQLQRPPPPPPPLHPAKPQQQRAQQGSSHARSSANRSPGGHTPSSLPAAVMTAVADRAARRQAQQPSAALQVEVSGATEEAAIVAPALLSGTVSSNEFFADYESSDSPEGTLCPAPPAKPSTLSKPVNQATQAAVPAASNSPAAEASPGRAGHLGFWSPGQQIDLAALIDTDQQVAGEALQQLLWGQIVLQQLSRQRQQRRPNLNKFGGVAVAGPEWLATAQVAQAP
eukprot:gene1924-2256_t